jgi:hypothetical protein
MRVGRVGVVAEPAGPVVAVEEAQPLYVPDLEHEQGE